MQMPNGVYYEWPTRCSLKEAHRVAAAFATELKGSPNLIAELLSAQRFGEELAA
jgi:hypothetical protein